MSSELELPDDSLVVGLGIQGGSPLAHQLWVMNGCSIVVSSAQVALTWVLRPATGPGRPSSQVRGPCRPSSRSQPPRSSAIRRTFHLNHAPVVASLPSMEALAERLSQLETQAEGALRVVLFYDTPDAPTGGSPGAGPGLGGPGRVRGRSAGRSVAALAMTLMTGAMAAMFLRSPST